LDNLDAPRNEHGKRVEGSWDVCAFLGAVIPFNLIVILPTNKRLLDPSLDKDSQLAEQLLHRWGALHAVRSALSLSSFLTFLYAAIWR
jgi:Domain of unknown function (DUF1772)